MDDIIPLLCQYLVLAEREKDIEFIGHILRDSLHMHFERLRGKIIVPSKDGI